LTTTVAFTGSSTACYRVFHRLAQLLSFHRTAQRAIVLG